MAPRAAKAMPEPPNVTVYGERLQAMLRGRVMEAVRIRNAFVLRTALPPLEEASGRTMLNVPRLGKRIVFSLGELERP